MSVRPLPEKFISINDAAVIVGVCPTTVRRWIAAGTLHGWMVVGTIRLDPTEVYGLAVPVGGNA